MFDVEIDNTTILLLAILLALLAYLRLFSRPEPLVHPLLLGKQSEVSNIRQEGETGIYRSWATGQGTPVSFTPYVSNVLMI
jgi:long-chain acyl-CoA synthetase